MIAFFWLIIEARHFIFFDSRKNTGRTNAQNSRSQEEFRLGLLALSALVIKVDGSTHQNELDYVRHHFVRVFGQQKANETFRAFNEQKANMKNVNEICLQLNRFIGYHAKLQVIHYLFSTARADGQLNQSENELIRKIASYLRISAADFASIRAMFTQQHNRPHSINHYYEILEITEKATDEEIKKAFRRLAQMHHPDKLADMGPAVQEEGKKKFLKIQEAYEKIKEARGMK